MQACAAQEGEALGGGRDGPTGIFVRRQKSDPVVDAWDAINELALEIIHMSVKPVHLNTVAPVDTAKKGVGRAQGHV